MTELHTITIIAAAGRDAAKVHSAALPCLHLCTALDTDGRFSVLSHPLNTSRDLMGIADQGGTPLNSAVFARSACALAYKRQAAGILADFARPSLAETVTALDCEAQQCGLTCWVPLCMADHAPHSIYIAETAISGGSLAQYFTDLLEHYGSGKIAAQLVRSCAKFSIPSEDADGTPMTMEQAQNLQAQAGAVPFFSRELCAKYFTCTENDMARFVLFDDEDTLRSKQELLTSLGVDKQILLYPDAVALGLLRTQKNCTPF